MKKETIKKEEKIILKLTKEQLYFLNKAVSRYKIKMRKEFLKKKSFIGNYVFTILDKNLTKKDWEDLNKKWNSVLLKWNKSHNTKTKKI